MVSFPGFWVTLCVQILSSLEEVSSIFLPALGGSLPHLMLIKARIPSADTFLPVIPQDASFGFGSEKQGKLSHDWEDANQNNDSKEVLSMPTTGAEVEVRESVWAS